MAEVGPEQQKVYQRLRRELVEELEEAQGQLHNLRERIISVESSLSNALDVLSNEEEPFDFAALPVLLSGILVGRGAFTERTVLIERAIEHARAYQRVFQVLREGEKLENNDG